MSLRPYGSLDVNGLEVQIARLGFGCARLFGGSETKASLRLIETALSCGLTHFDTAPSYGDGQSEVVLGQALAGVSGVTVTTKVGIDPGKVTSSRLQRLYRKTARPLLARTPKVKSALLRWNSSRSSQTSAKSSLQSVRALDCDEVDQSLESSMLRLRRDRIDILLIHEPDGILLDDKLKEHLEYLKRDGVIGAFGLGWDRSVASPPSFGTILQSRFRSNGSEEQSKKIDEKLEIFHGILRHGERAELLPVQKVRQVLTNNRNSAFIISASTPAQIRNISS